MNVARLAAPLYLLFTLRAHFLARTTQFIRRVRAFDGPTFLQVMVFGWLRRPDVPLEHLAGDLDISRQALHRRFNAAAVAFCKGVLLEALEQAIQADPDLLGCLRDFRGVYIDDCTHLRVPDDTDPQAGTKLLLRWELQGGAIRHLGLHPGHTGDTTTLEQAPPLPKGCLHLADLGFTDFARLQAEDDAGLFWLS